MTYSEIMALWNRANRRLWPYFAMAFAGPFLFVGMMEFEVVHRGMLLVGLACFWALCGIIYGDLADELIKISSWANEFKMERLVEDLGELAHDMPLMRVVAGQEDGNLRYPSRIVFIMKGRNKPIVYDWQKHRFARYKWPVLPFSIEKAITRAKQQT